MTAQGTVETAVEAIKQGAYDYLSKPIDPQRLKILLDQIAERHDTLREVRALRRQLQERGTFGKMIGSSLEMRKIYQVIEQAAPTSASVLDQRRVGHRQGTGRADDSPAEPARAQPFVPLNCAAIPDTLLECELFGHEKGAFTGAIARRQGAFELANRGTLFLDEIAEMTPATQAKLLRVLQERTFRTLGGQREQSVDIRVIAATNVDPPEAVRAGQAARGPVLPAERVRDSAAAAARSQGRHPAARAGVHHASSTRATTGRRRRVRRGACSVLERYDWPGNVRELRNVIERATIVAQGHDRSTCRICRRSPDRRRRRRRRPARRAGLDAPARRSTKPSAS